MTLIAIALGLIPCYIFAKKMGFFWCTMAYILGAVGLIGTFMGYTFKNNAPLTSFFRTQFGNLFFNMGYKAFSSSLTLTMNGIVTLLLIAMFLWLLLILGGFYVSTEFIIGLIIISLIYPIYKTKKQIKTAKRNYYFKSGISKAQIKP